MKDLLLAIDVGNTQSVFGLFCGRELLATWRLPTRKDWTSDEIAALLYSTFSTRSLAAERVGSLTISTVVPRLKAEFEKLSRDYFDVVPLVVGHDVATGIEIEYENPSEIGADRIANAVGAVRLYGDNCLVVDFGTATTFDVVTDGKRYAGGVIMPGFEISAEALFARAARLFKIELAAPVRVIGKNTADSIRSGLMFGYPGMVDRVVTLIAKELGRKFSVIATGGLSRLLGPRCETVEIIDPELTLKGLMFIHELNKSSHAS